MNLPGISSDMQPSFLCLTWKQLMKSLVISFTNGLSRRLCKTWTRSRTKFSIISAFNLNFGRWFAYCSSESFVELWAFGNSSYWWWHLNAWSNRNFILCSCYSSCNRRICIHCISFFHCSLCFISLLLHTAHWDKGCGDHTECSKQREFGTSG